MKTLFKILPLAILLVACGGNKDEKTKKKIMIQKQKIVKLEQKIAALESTLADTSQQVKNIPVQVKNMQEEAFNHYFLVYGNVEADQYGMITPEMSGRLAKIFVREGQVVQQGELLLSLNTEAIEKQIAGVQAGLELASTTYEKQKALWDQEIGSEIQYLQAKSNKETLEAQLEGLESQLRMAQLRAPYEGTVNKIYAKVGELVGPGMAGIEFVNLDQITIRANVSENYIGVVKKGQAVEVSFGSLNHKTIQTEIVRVSKVINAKNRTFEIELRVGNKDKSIKPNMVSTIKISDYKSEKALLIPSLILRKDISGNYIYVVHEDKGKHVVDKKYVRTSLSYDDQTLVTEGLKVGDQVIVKGYNLVSTGIPVDIK